MQRIQISTLVPGVVLGVGLGGFLDGIVLHQLLQWHHLISSRESASTVAGLEENMFWDGIFHAAMWLIVAAGIALVIRDRRRHADNRAIFGGALLGWGGFTAFDAIVNHWILELHHIREGVDNEPAYDVAFFAFGVVLLVAGALTQRRRTEH